MSIELQLWCQQRYCDRYHRLRVLPVPGGSHALWLDDGRVRAVVSKNNPPANSFDGLQLALVRNEENGDKPQWFLREGKAWSPLDQEEEALDLLDAADVEPDKNLRKLVVEAIEHDHKQQLTGNLLAGFVKRLDQQFPRAELYLFELLQNAVDEGAQRVSFEIRDGALVFQHDGEAFNASDVLGLSAVGATGKSGRTIGFMGLGFKSVYSRFDRVVLCDGEWSFFYERPGETLDGGWKFLPKWCDAIPPENGFRCRFDFSRVKGSPNALTEDIRKLDDVIPVLLARRSLRKEGDVWELNWNGRRIRVARESDGPSGVEYFNLVDSGKRRRWFFLGTCWTPSAEAIKSWRDFRDDPQGDPGEQELALFAELDEKDNLLNGQTAGVLHAVLPTAKTLPLGFNLQANWLLQADRQGPMSARDNAWNADIVSHLPDLIVGLLQWIADGKGPPEIEEPYRRLPKLRITTDGRPVLDILDIEVDFSLVTAALCTSPLVPSLDSPEPELENPQSGNSIPPAEQDRSMARRWVVRPEMCVYKFVRADECRYLPDAFLSELAPQFIRSWLGGFPPFALSMDKDSGNFFRSSGIIHEPSDQEWESAAANYQSILQSLPSDRVRAWVAIHIVATVLRCRYKEYTPPDKFVILPNGNWQLRGMDDLVPPPRQYLQLEKNAREILAPDLENTPALALMLALVAPPSENERDNNDAQAVAMRFWPRGSEKRLRDITESFFTGLARNTSVWNADPTDIIRRVVTVTAALRPLPAGHEAVTHVLAVESGHRRLLPKGEVWVGDAYGFPHIEVAASGKIPLVASDYGNDSEWHKFFGSICQTRLEPKWKILEQFYSWDNRIFNYLSHKIYPGQRFTTLDLPFGLGSGERDDIHILGTDIQPWVAILQECEFDLVQARAFATVVALGKYSPNTFGGSDFLPTKVYVTWAAAMHRREYKVSEKYPLWVCLLKDRPWVPTSNGRVVPPRDVLLRPDSHNPDAPFADLDDAVRRGLEPLAAVVNFGEAVPRPGPLAVLLGASQRPEISDRALVPLWHDVLGDDDLDVKLLRDRASVLELIPVSNPRRDGKRRITSKRLVVAGNYDFGGFLAAVADTLLADRANRLLELLDIPKQPIAYQAVDYLEWVWAQEPPDVEDAVVSAWRTIVAEPSEWPQIRKHLERGAVKLFCRQPGVRRGAWLQLPSAHPREPVWNDAPDKAACLHATDGIWLEAWISRRKHDFNVDDLLKLLDISRLSDDRFHLAVHHSGGKPMPEETERLHQITQAVRALREEEDLLTTDLVLRSVQSINRTFRIGDADPRVEQLDATWDGKEYLYVVGNRAAAWATDLRPLVQQALGLGGNARALRLLDLIPLLDDPENFKRKFDQLCRELDIPFDAFGEAESPKTKNGPEEDVRSRGPHGPEEDVRSRGPHGPEEDDGSNQPNGPDTGGKKPGHSGQPPGHPPRPGQAPNRFLIDGSGNEEEEEQRAVREQRLPKDDANARRIVMDYEQREGRQPKEADRYQAGYDVLSGDGKRKIEVKGLQGAWQSDATVTMTGRQFDDARTQDGDWWLYVVENLGTDHPSVIAIPNPAKGTSRFYLYARHWRDKAETKPSKPLPGPDDDEE